MSLTLLSTPEDLEAYREYLKKAPGSSLWQSLEWKGYQEALGRETRLYGLVMRDQTSEMSFEATALVIIDKTAFGLSTWDIPRGPLGKNSETREKLLKAIAEEAQKEKCMALYFSPQSDLSLLTSHPSSRHEQPETTLALDLSLSEEELQKQMKPKGRYNIGVAVKHGVTVEESKDVDAFFTLLKGTSERDAFGILPKSHYEHFLKDLPGSFLLLASSTEAAKKPIAGLLGITWGNRGYYYYGASSYADRALMAPYALQWEAVKLCRNRGARTYDLLGIAPTEPATCNLQPTTSSHPWAGVTRFKMQFGGSTENYPPEQEIILKPVAKKLLEWKRKVWR